MSVAFSFILIAGIITGFCILICIVFVSYKISEAWNSSSLMDADFPPAVKNFNKKSFRKYEEFYSRPSSDTRTAMGYMYSEENVEVLKRKGSPQKFPKGRYSK